MGIAFRPAQPADAGALTALVAALGHADTPSRIHARLLGLLAAPEHALLVAEEDGALLGWVHVQEFLSLASEPTALLTGLAVDARARRRGVGRALMEAAEAWARARGLGAMRLRARVARRGAHAFYARLGYTRAKRQLQFHKPLDPAR